MKTNENTIITQDVKALISQLGRDKIQIIMIQNVSTDSQNSNREKDTSNLWDIFRSLPEPRWENLKLALLDVLEKNIRSDSQRAAFSGLASRTLHGWRREKKKKEPLYLSGKGYIGDEIVVIEPPEEPKEG